MKRGIFNILPGDIGHSRSVGLSPTFFMIMFLFKLVYKTIVEYLFLEVLCCCIRYEEIVCTYFLAPSKGCVFKSYFVPGVAQVVILRANSFNVCE